MESFLTQFHCFHRSLAALQTDIISMAAGELLGNVAMAVGLVDSLPRVTHVVCFTDSSASAGALNSGNSSSLQVNVLVQWLFQRLAGVQLLGVHQPGVRNERADGISREREEAVLREAAAAGAVLLRLPVGGDVWDALQRARDAPQRRG